MRTLAILTFITLDGVMQAPGDLDEDRSGGFELGGWARPCWDDVMQQVMQEAMAEPYDLLLGKTTYDLFTASFADSGNNNPVAEKLNSATKYVVTSRTSSLKWQNSERITGNIETAVARLKDQDGPLLQIHGSWQLIQTLLYRDLIDEYRLWTFPVVVGIGKRLFGEGGMPTNLELIKAESCPSGAVMTIYRRIPRAAI